MNDGPATGGRSQWRRWLGFAIGLCLLVAAVYMVVRQPDELQRALNQAHAAPWWLVALAIILPCLNWLQMSAVFWHLTRRRAPARVPIGEMTALIGSAWLLNYIPMRPGLFGRIALHRTLHDIPVRDSTMVLVENIACGAVAIAFALVGIIAMRFAIPSWQGALLCTALLAPPLMAIVLLHGAWRTWSQVTLLRSMDLLVWSARYATAAQITGNPVSASEAISLAIVSQIAMLVPLAGNGLGLREWAIGFTAASLPAAWSMSSQGMTSETGLLVDLMNRAAELAAAIPVGIVCGMVVARRIAQGKPENR